MTFSKQFVEEVTKQLDRDEFSVDDFEIEQFSNFTTDLQFTYKYVENYYFLLKFNENRSET
ncbi:hypothetical protein V5E38_01300 [Rossellomorea sp. GAMAL-10_SWC]